jgi:hypothetical protein
MSFLIFLKEAYPLPCFGLSVIKFHINNFQDFQRFTLNILVKNYKIFSRLMNDESQLIIILVESDYRIYTFRKNSSEMK